MRKIAILFLAATMSLASCTRENDECQKVQEENAALREAAEASDKQLEEINQAMNDVESNLEGIEVNKTRVDSLRNSGATQKEKINDLIGNINTYIEQNRTRVDELENSLKKSRNNSASLKKLVARLRRQITAKERQIDSMYATIQGLNARVADLDSNLNNTRNELSSTKDQLGNRTREYEQADTELHTAFYIVGTRKDLINAKVLDKQGGVLGLGKTTKISGHFDDSKFTQVNIRNVADIEIGQAKKVTLVSSHPNGTYSIIDNGGAKTLKISDYKRFWASSKYLVIEVDK